MRPFEIALVLIVLAAAVWRLSGSRRTTTHRIMAAVSLVLAVLQYAVEGYRWQLFAPYAVAIALAAAAWTSPRQVMRPRWRATGWLVAGLIGAGVPVMLPIPRLPVPDGPYAVGTTTYVAVDESRVEVYGPTPGGPRILPIHVWYPADPSPRPASGWLSPDVTRAVSVEFGLPGFFLDHLRLTETHAVRDAPLVGDVERFPIVIYSHGWTGFGRISPDQAERLASHGYIVIAPDHTYGALVADLSGGLVEYDRTALPSEDSIPEAVDSAGASGALISYLGEGLVGFDPAALPDEETVDAATYEEASRLLVATFAADLRFVLDLVTQPGALGLSERFDTDHIGIYGHSTGGGAAIAACHDDVRCDAVLGLDPWVEPVDPGVIADGLLQPFLALRSDPWVGEENDAVLFALHRAGTAPSTILALRGANHYDFVALSQISPLARYLGFKGPIPGPIAQEIIGAELVSFFDLYLKGIITAVPGFEQIRLDEERG